MHYNLPTFVDYDIFLGCDMDAVVLANYFHQHTPFAIKALNAGKLIFGKLLMPPRLRASVSLTVQRRGISRDRPGRPAFWTSRPTFHLNGRSPYADSCLK